MFIVQAYSMIAQRYTPEVLAEHLHQKWMADARFAPVAASIILHIHRVNTPIPMITKFDYRRMKKEWDCLRVSWLCF